MNTQKQNERKNRLMPVGIPKWIRCYDGGPDYIGGDRYTVVYTRLQGKVDRRAMCQYVGMNSEPYHGIGMHGEADHMIDRSSHKHLGLKIQFTDLPAQCKKLVISDYKELWSIT